MNLTIFQSHMGDCLLLEAKSKHLFLCDGGMRISMTEHVRAELGQLRTEGRDIDFAYISHIDNDHITGILQLLEDEVEWRVFDHHKQNGTPIREPRVPRPPNIRGILHNGFRDQLESAAKPIESLLATAVPSLFATGIPRLVKAASEMQAIVTGVPEAIKVGKLVSAGALNIPLNVPPGATGPGKLLLVGQLPGDTFSLGSMKFTLLGPTKQELENVRRGWRHWLKNNKDRVKKIRAELKKRVDEFSAGALSTSPFDLRDWEGVPDFKGVTAPNVASLMFMVEEEGKHLLLTGDCQQDIILAGLDRANFMPNGHVHLDVLKVQHHGSENNMDVDFAQKVSADHYVFCGNGSHTNPELTVLDIVFNSRVGPNSVRALAPQADGRPFHFWFSTTSAAQRDRTEMKKQMKRVEGHVADLAAQSGGLLTLHFNQNAATNLAI